MANEDKDNEESKSSETEGVWGKRIATLGAGMLALSVVLVFLGVSGATMHNILQLGGIGILIIGLVLWKAVKI